MVDGGKLGRQTDAKPYPSGWELELLFRTQSLCTADRKTPCPDMHSRRLRKRKKEKKDGVSIHY